MVLGIDEYLPKKRKDKDVNFIAFKKYYQRIYKRTGCEYKKWINELINAADKDKMWENEHQLMYEKYIKEGFNGDAHAEILLLEKLKENRVKHNIYFFGHSLDVTDKDILQNLILNDNVKTTIFYYNKEIMGQQIANIVKVIGQDELIR